MEMVAILSLVEFENLCVNRIGLAEYKLRQLKDNIEEGAAQSYEKTAEDIQNIIMSLTRAKLDIEMATRTIAKEYSNDKN